MCVTGENIKSMGQQVQTMYLAGLIVAHEDVGLDSIVCRLRRLNSEEVFP